MQTAILHPIRTLEEIAKQAGVNSAPYLGGRAETGRPMREAIGSLLQALPAGATLVISLDGPKDITSSVADEIGPRLVGDLLNGEFGDKFIAYMGGTADTKFALQEEFTRPERLGKIVARVEGFHSLIFGELPPYLLETLTLIIERGTITTEDLAKELEIPLSNAGKRVKELFDLRLIKRTHVPLQQSGGRQFVYSDILDMEKGE